MKKPQWAKKIPAKIWRDLHKCQHKTPTLKNLKADLQIQSDHNIRCETCISAGRIAGIL